MGPYYNLNFLFRYLSTVDYFQFYEILMVIIHLESNLNPTVDNARFPIQDTSVYQLTWPSIVDDNNDHIIL